MEDLLSAERLLTVWNAVYGWLLTHVFELEEYRDAIAVALGKSAHGSIKVAFRPGD